ncbi:MAG: hypothetical protein IKV73_00670 [Clostridia bacterium]|nr:hypothetical protein [Clostridia bacterium]
MYRRYYDGYGSARVKNDVGEIIVPKSNMQNTYEIQENSHCDEPNNQIEISSKGKGFLGSSLDIDDLILIGVLLFLLYDSDDNDPVLLIIIGYLLLSEIL